MKQVSLLCCWVESTWYTTALLGITLMLRLTATIDALLTDAKHGIRYYKVFMRMRWSSNAHVSSLGA